MDKLSMRVADAKKTSVYWAEAAKMDFADNLYSRMEEQNITRADLARRLDVSGAYITKILGGTINFSIESMTKLAFAFGSRIDIKFSKIESASINDSYSLQNTGVERNLEEESTWSPLQDTKKQNIASDMSDLYIEENNNGHADYAAAA